jgi:hypothetical protein
VGIGFLGSTGTLVHIWAGGEQMTLAVEDNLARTAVDGQSLNICAVGDKYIRVIAIDEPRNKG